MVLVHRVRPLVVPVPVGDECPAGSQADPQHDEGNPHMLVSNPRVEVPQSSHRAVHTASVPRSGLASTRKRPGPSSGRFEGPDRLRRRTARSRSRGSSSSTPWRPISPRTRSSTRTGSSSPPRTARRSAATATGTRLRCPRPWWPASRGRRWTRDAIDSVFGRSEDSMRTAPPAEG